MCISLYKVLQRNHVWMPNVCEHDIYVEDSLTVPLFGTISTSWSGKLCLLLDKTSFILSITLDLLTYLDNYVGI